MVKILGCKVYNNCMRILRLGFRLLEFMTVVFLTMQGVGGGVQGLGLRGLACKVQGLRFKV